MSDRNSNKYAPAALEARQKYIADEPQRVQPLREEEFDGDARALVTEVRKALGVDETTSIPPVFGAMLKAPGLFRCQVQMGIELLGKGAISPRERELVILRVGWRCRAPYVWGEHVDVAKRYGVTPEEVERVTQGSGAPGWSGHDRAIIKAVEELLEDQMIANETWSTLSQRWTERQLIELPILVGQYFTIIMQQNSLRIQLASNNIGLKER